jgi:SAM-dependent methyltransferase
VVTRPWQWDPSLYAGSAAHYSRGRMPYPDEVADLLRAELGLDGTGRLLDIGCGPGSMTLLLAPHVAAAVGIDADAEMIAEARRRGTALAAGNVEWRQVRAEELPAGLGTFRVVTFAQSFHWVDQPLVARRVRGMLERGGAWVHVGATTHRGGTGDDDLDRPRPPWDDIQSLIERHLGPVRRAGQGSLPDGTRSGEDDVMRAAGFAGPTRLTVPGGRVVHRGAEEIVSAVFSLSSSAPHLFGDRLADVETQLRRLLAGASPDGGFAETTEDLTITVWRP